MENGETVNLLTNKWLVLIAAMLVWAVYFYAMDWLIMEGQGLPVQANLMPK